MGTPVCASLRRNRAQRNAHSHKRLTGETIARLLARLIAGGVRDTWLRSLMAIVMLMSGLMLASGASATAPRLCVDPSDYWSRERGVTNLRIGESRPGFDTISYSLIRFNNGQAPGLPRASISPEPALDGPDHCAHVPKSMERPGPVATQTLALLSTTGAASGAHPDYQFIVAKCEAVMEALPVLRTNPEMIKGVAGQFAYLLRNVRFALEKARSGEPNVLRMETERLARLVGSPSALDYDASAACFYRTALTMFEGGRSAPVPPPVPSPGYPVAGPPVRTVASATSAGPPPRPAPRELRGEVKYGVESSLGPRGNAALDKAMLPGPAIPAMEPAAVTAQRRGTQASREKAGFQQMRGRKVHNQANDATGCLKVIPTGVVSEWGIEGRYRLLNTCSYPVEAAWCSSTAECDGGRGNLWTIRPSGGYPIFGGDPDNPDIRVGGCKGGDAKAPPLGQQDVERTGFSEARAMPVPAPGVSLLSNHRCE